MQDSTIAFPACFPTFLPICTSYPRTSAFCSQCLSGDVPCHRYWCKQHHLVLHRSGSEKEQMGFLGLSGAAACRQVMAGSPPGVGRQVLVLIGLVCSAHAAMSAVYKFHLGCFFFICRYWLC